jgi:hypothetical protein
MNFRAFLTPAYITSLVLLLLAAILISTGLGVLGWLVLLIGLALNVVASSVTSNREELRRAEREG